MNLEELLRREREADAPNPLVDRTAELVARVRRRRRGIATTAVAGLTAVAVGAVVVLGQVLAPQPDVPPAVSPPPAPTLDTSRTWGPGVSYVTLGGVPYAGTQRWPDVEVMASFTVVSTGVVYVDPAGDRLVWAGWDRSTRVLGPAPWHADPLGAPYGGAAPYPWGKDRDVIGSLSGDLVAWVESADGRRGDLVVARPSTGLVVARTPVPGAPELPVWLAGVDDTRVYFALPPDAAGSTVLGHDVWVWPWADSAAPRADEVRDSDRVLDVSGDVWAVENGQGVQFQDAAGTVLSTVPTLYSERVQFGTGLSPDGRFWYAPFPNEFVRTANGERIPTDAEWGDQYGWTGSTRLTAIDPLNVCDAGTGVCSAPVDIPVEEPCRYTESCRYGLPAY